MEKFHDNITKELKKINLDIKFKFIKKIDYKPDVIFVCSIYRLENPYKNDLKYTEGLKEIIHHFPLHFPKMCLRIYIDNSFLKKDESWVDFYNLLIKTKFVELIQYDFQQFKINNIFHNSSLGMTIRLFSMFNFSSIQETIVIIDVDYQKWMNDVVNHIKTGLKIIKDKKANIIFNCYQLETFIDKPRLLIKPLIDKYDFIIRTISQPTIINKKMDKNVIIEFIKCMYVKCKNFNDWVQELNKVLQCGIKPQKTTKQIDVCKDIFELKNSPHGIFMFGVDEYFINYYIFEYLIHNKIEFCVKFEFPSMANYHYFIFNFLFQKNRIKKYFIENMYNTVLQNIHTNNIYKNYKKLDKILFIDQPQNMIKYNKYLKPTEINKHYSSLLYKYLKTKILDNTLYNSLQNIDSYELNLYKKYFSLLTTMDLKDFGIPGSYYNIKYKKNNIYEFEKI
jgi:hypothetical protein